MSDTISGLPYFPCKIWRYPRAQPIAAKLGRSVAFAQSAIAQALDQYGFSGSKRPILHGKYDNPNQEAAETESSFRRHGPVIPMANAGEGAPVPRRQSPPLKPVAARRRHSCGAPRGCADPATLLNNWFISLRWTNVDHPSTVIESYTVKIEVGTTLPVRPNHIDGGPLAYAATLAAVTCSEQGRS